MSSSPIQSAYKKNLSSSFAKNYGAKYQTFRNQAEKQLKHPLFPGLIIAIITIIVFLSIGQIWLRTQPFTIARSISQELSLHQNLIEQKKHLVLKLSQQRSEWHAQASELNMVYPTEFIEINTKHVAAKGYPL